MLRNNPETIIGGRIGTQGRIEYFFKTFGAVAILFIEMKLKVGNDAERLKAIAQVIAECGGKFQRFRLTPPAPDLLDVQAATSTTPLKIFLYLSTAFSPMAGPSNFSSLKESQILLFYAAALTGIRSTSGVACKYPTLLPWRLLFLSFSSFDVYARQSLT